MPVTNTNALHTEEARVRNLYPLAGSELSASQLASIASQDTDRLAASELAGFSGIGGAGSLTRPVYVRRSMKMPTNKWLVTFDAADTPKLTPARWGAATPQEAIANSHKVYTADCKSTLESINTYMNDLEQCRARLAKLAASKASLLASVASG